MRADVLVVSLALVGACSVDVVQEGAAGAYAVSELAAGPAWSPTVSPDGASIAFLAPDPDDSLGPDGLYVARRDGTDRVLIAEGYAFYGAPVFSPDGSLLAYRQSERLYVANSDGSGLPALVSGGLLALTSAYGVMAFAPDSSRLAFSARPSPCQSDELCTERIFLASVDGSGSVPVSPPDVEGAYSPVFSQDGAKIASTNGGGGSIAVFDADPGGVSESFYLGGLFTYGPLTFSPDGTDVYFRASLGYSDADIFAVSTDERTLVNLTDTPDVEKGTSIASPDGTAVLFPSPRGLEVVDPATGVTTTAVAGAGLSFAWSPQAWLPDGSGFVFSDRNAVWLAERPSAEDSGNGE